ncbi:MAG: hypothetical protein GX643_08200 [Acidimicrobiales bacterium]|nr:hypothetical protein [Acidimicrobiales bacterium]
MSRAAAVRLALLAVLATAAAVLVRMLRGPEAPAFTTPTTTGVLAPPDPPQTTTPGRTDPSGPPANPSDAGQHEDEIGAAPPPEVTEPAGAADPGQGQAPKANPPGERWVFPVDGDCPDGHPIKAKLRSGIYHLPGMIAYARTIPDRCYATEIDAEADGLRRAKR